MNYFLNQNELESGIERSKWLSSPPEETLELDQISETTPEERRDQLAEEQKTARDAINRIANLGIGNSKDRMRVNIQRCISTFGRHNTDTILPPKPGRTTSAKTVSEELAEKEAKGQQTAFPRIGEDTGSSEVQIAILTAKIRALADFLATRGTTDKVNKRNLRLLVHKRQKHLKYLRRSDRGGARWQHCIETLGLTEGTWKGEISL